VENTSYRLGMLSSVKCGMRAVGAGYDAVLFALGDQPHIAASVVSELIRRYRQGTAGIVIPRYGAKKGHPIILNVPRYREAILNLPDDVGLNALIQEHIEDVCLIDMATEDIIRDIDHPEDYAQELARLTGRRLSV